jgi:DNA-binding PadR family transcriptional regulator
MLPLAGRPLYAGTMPDSQAPRLSLPEWLVLSLICEKPTHGFAIARTLGPGSSLGRVWRVPKPVIYRAMQRLEVLGLVRTAGEQDSSRGPVRSLSKATPAARRAAEAWLSTPVAHARDVRSEVLVKLALLDRAEADPRELLRAQQAQLVPIATALDDRLRSTEAFEYTLALRRREAMSATMRFLAAAPSPA